jgi:hypothetical protein
MEPLPVAIVCALIAATIGITAFAKRRNLDTGDHYVAGRRLSGWQNGLALAGDQISAASFLGITGAVALTGMTASCSASGCRRRSCSSCCSSPSRCATSGASPSRMPSRRASRAEACAARSR